jgi:hypothetical protein
MNSWRLHEQFVLRTLRETSGPERAEGFDCGLFRPPLRASLELGAKHSVETCTKIFLRLQVLIHEFKELVSLTSNLLLRLSTYSIIWLLIIVFKRK